MPPPSTSSASKPQPALFRLKLTPEEWAAINEHGNEEDQKKHGEVFGKEWKVYEQPCDELAEKKQYDNDVMDIRVLYEEAVIEGYGSEESRKVYCREVVGGARRGVGIAGRTVDIE